VDALVRLSGSFPPVLDVCCGPRMMWYDKDDARAIYIDERDEDIETNPNAAYKNGKTFRIRPTIRGTFAAIPLPNDSFWHVVFDPPHLKAIDDPRSLMRVQYGQLFPGWQDLLRQGFAECFRVLKPNGTLIFKWCEYDVPVSEVLALTPEKPLYGHRSGKQSKTHWIAFLKPNVGIHEG
jgi:SAM-dependent methyltransferase